MKLLSVIIAWTLIVSPLTGLYAQTPTQFQTDILKFGRGSSATAKQLIWDSGDGALNKMLSLDPSDNQFDMNSTLNITGDLNTTGAVNATGAVTGASANISGTSRHQSGLTLGSGSDATKQITVDRSGFDPYLKWDETLDKWVFSNDGTIEKKLGSGSGSGGGGINLLTNGSFEDGVAVNWSNTGGTVTGQTYTNSYEGNTAFARFESTVIGDYIETTAVAVPDNFGVGCQTTLKVKITSGTWNVRVIDGSAADLIDTFTIIDPGPTTGQWLDVPVKSLRCPAAGSTFKLRITSSATGIIDLDDAYLGSNKNTGPVNVGGYMGKLDFSTSDCSFTTTSGSVTDVSDATCTKTGSGRVEARTDNVLGFKGTFPKGFCTVTMEGTFSMTTAAATGDVTADIRIYDSTNSVAGTVKRQGFTSGGSFSVSMRADTNIMKFASTGSAQELKIQLAAVNAESIAWNGGTMFVECSSDSTSEAVTTSQAEWFIDANIGGGNPTLGTVSVASYTEITNSSLDLVLNNGSATAKIPCSSTNAATGLTCSAGSESVGINFNNPTPGHYEACFAFTHGMDNAASTNFSTTFQLVQTTNATQTIIQEGKERTHSFATNVDVYTPHKNCGTFYFSDAGEKTIRLMYEQEVTGTPTQGYVLADRNATIGQRDVHIVVRPLLSAHNRPIILGKKKYQTKTLAADATCAAGGSCAITDLTFSNLTVGKIYSITFHTQIAQAPGTSSGCSVYAKNGATTLGHVREYIQTSNHNGTHEINKTFVASASTVTFNFDDITGGTCTLQSSGGVFVYATLVEENDMEATTQW